ncbi:568_t:CDS:1 [Funneliformis mosseae]|uniref:568_t:CDS:1 n=1 Tax=Funneliformis mosseae TaxID=27381 RepID=A0A9N8Z8Z7_FUNMO|nr:568_t:CDS:1 [Funneliformis mosseae]
MSLPYNKNGTVIDFGPKDVKNNDYDERMIQKTILEETTPEEREELQRFTFLNLNELIKPKVRLNNDKPPPRPQNAFVIFRKDYQARLTSQHPTLSSAFRDISTTSSKLWKEASDDQKNCFNRLSDLAKSLHEKIWPTSSNSGDNAPASRDNSLPQPGNEHAESQNVEVNRRTLEIDPSTDFFNKYCKEVLNSLDKETFL